MRLYNIIILFAILIFSFTSCTDDLLYNGEEKCVVGDDVLAEINFGDNSYDDVTITMRSTQDGEFEHLVTNMYVLLFNSETHEKVYGKYFDIKTREGNIDAVNNSNKECWYSDHAKLSDDNDKDGYKQVTKHTTGKIKMKVPTGGPFNLYIFSNIEARYLQLSPQVFDGFTNEDDLRNYRMDFLGNPVYRTGMLMLGQEVKDAQNTDGGINISAAGVITRNKDTKQITSDNPVLLERLDAKIEFRVHIDPTKYDKDKNSLLKDFIPESWEVVNIPNTSILIKNNENGYVPKPNDKEGDFYFSTIPNNFEAAVENPNIPMINTDGTLSDTKHVNDYIFSFYMLENHQQAKKDIDVSDKEVSPYHKRDLRLKTEEGRYAATKGDMWEYAPQWGTYIKIKGKVEMQYKKGNMDTNKPQTLFADVAYYIHLGDFDQDINNYSINRNTRYTYTVSIVDVNKIILEVESSNKGDFKEPQSGAVGDVVVAKEKIAVFDAHYGQQVFRFLAEYVDQNLTWYVETPFSKGTPLEQKKGLLDYKWVHFFRNIVNKPTKEKNYEHYSHNNRWYPGDEYDSPKEADKLMDVDELILYLKKQKNIYNDNIDNNLSREQLGKGNDFKKEVINGKTYWVIYFTAFVDEYFYDKKPVSGETPPKLWTQFVNDAGDRIMHILCDNLHSKDFESSRTNSVTTIRQRPIQTPFTSNINYAPDTAWGCETIDESGFDYQTGTNGMPFDMSTKTPNDEVHGGANGLYNTYHSFLTGSKNWDVYMKVEVNKSGPNNGKKTLQWELPVNYDPTENIEGALPQDIHFLRDDYCNLRYSFLQRNRDNNGNGIIDPEEIRWYVASIQQLAELYIGGRGMTGEAQLYPEKISRYTLNDVYDKKSIFAGAQKWRHHVVSSTIETIYNSWGKASDYKAKILWAEEGLSIGFIGDDTGKAASLSVRCIRNLGYKKFTVDKSSDIPDPLIVIKEGSNKVDCRRVNLKSLRGGGELDANLTSLGTCDENEQFALVPLGFEFLDSDTSYEWNKSVPGEYDYDKLKYILDNGLESNYPKPIGVSGVWRLPNIRELGILEFHQRLKGEGKYFTPFNYYSHGIYGTNNDPGTRSWYAANNFMSLWDGTKSFDFVFVRDWNPEN